ncbi:hypothetical protein JCM11251_005461 [Rhodosporidiobolus azoricus]
MAPTPTTKSITVACNAVTPYYFASPRRSARLTISPVSSSGVPPAKATLSIPTESSGLALVTQSRADLEEYDKDDVFASSMQDSPLSKLMPVVNIPSSTKTAPSAVPEIPFKSEDQENKAVEVPRSTPGKCGTAFAAYSKADSKFANAASSAFLAPAACGASTPAYSTSVDGCSRDDLDVELGTTEESSLLSIRPKTESLPGARLVSSTADFNMPASSGLTSHLGPAPTPATFRDSTTVDKTSTRTKRHRSKTTRAQDKEMTFLSDDEEDLLSPSSKKVKSALSSSKSASVSFSQSSSDHHASTAGLSPRSTTEGTSRSATLDLKKRTRAMDGDNEKEKETTKKAKKKGVSPTSSSKAVSSSSRRSIQKLPSDRQNSASTLAPRKVSTTEGQILLSTNRTKRTRDDSEEEEAAASKRNSKKRAPSPVDDADNFSEPDCTPVRRSRRISSRRTVSTISLSQASTSTSARTIFRWATSTSSVSPLSSSCDVSASLSDDDDDEDEYDAPQEWAEQLMRSAMKDNEKLNVSGNLNKGLAIFYTCQAMHKQEKEQQEAERRSLKEGRFTEIPTTR